MKKNYKYQPDKGLDSMLIVGKAKSATIQMDRESRSNNWNILMMTTDLQLVFRIRLVYSIF